MRHVFLNCAGCAFVIVTNLFLKPIVHGVDANTKFLVGFNGVLSCFFLYGRLIFFRPAMSNAFYCNFVL